MPVNKAFNMDSLRKGVADYIEKTNRRVTFEYILLDDVNDSLAHARQLAPSISLPCSFLTVQLICNLNSSSLNSST